MLSHGLIFRLVFVFFLVQNGLSLEPFSELDTSLTGKRQTEQEETTYFPQLGYSDVSVDRVFTDEFTSNSDLNLELSKISESAEENENLIEESKNEQDVDKPRHLSQFNNEFERDRRSAEHKKERSVSSHISLLTTDESIRVDFSGDSSLEEPDTRPRECRYITSDNRRLIENLADAINCGSFPHIENGRFELFLGDLDDDIEPRIKCDPFHVRLGPENGALVCTDGKWHFDARCHRIRCKNLDVPRNGLNISMTGLHFNDTAAFSCVYGYQLIGDEIMVCGGNGRWIGEIPTCELIQCPKVTAPENGYVTDDPLYFTNQTSLGPSDFNTTITYWCQEGYTLVGKSDSTCQSNGRWSQRKVPVCKRVCLITFNTRLSSTVWLQPRMNPIDRRTEFKYGQQIIYLCKRRYRSDNDGGSMCKNGKWIPPIKCRRIYACTDPKPPQNGRIASKINKSFIQYACHNGYQISGSESQTCLANGTWSGTKPECRKMCSMPKVFGMKDAWLSFQFKKFKQGNQLLVGSMVEYSCKSGYVTARTEPSTCQDGDWIPPPLCLSALVRLAGYQGHDEGLVEVYINGNWGLVCDHMFVHFGRWDVDESKVVCKMLGYVTGRKEDAAKYQRITSHVSFQSVSCSGDEESILECNTMRAKVWCNRFIAVKCFRRMTEN